MLHACAPGVFFSFEFEEKSNDFDQHISPRLQVIDN
jgi:hypothetical protein